MKQPWPALQLCAASAGVEVAGSAELERGAADSGGVRIPVYQACLKTIYACGLRLLEGTRLQVPGTMAAPLLAAVCRVPFAARCSAVVSPSGHIAKRAHVHTLRHSYVTHLLELGFNLRVIQDHLGHRSPRTTALYTHLTREVRATITDPLNQLMEYL